MKTKILFLSSLLLLLFGGVQPVQASLSIGPSGVHEKLEVGMEVESSFRIGRIYPDQVADFTVEISGSATEFIDLHGQNEFTIERGEYGYEYKFSIDTTGAPVGEYQAIVEFIQETTADTGAAMAIRYGVKGTVNIEVVEEFTPEDNPTNLSGTTDLISGLSVLDLKADQDIYSAGSQANFTWIVKNNLENEAFVSIPIEATIYLDGTRISGMSGGCSQMLVPEGECEKSYSFDIPNRKKGNYSLVVNVAGNVESLTFTVQTPFYQTNLFFGILVGLGLLCLVILFIYSDLLIMYLKYLHEHNKKLLRRGSVKMKKIRILRYKKLTGSVIVAIVIFGFVTTYLSIPKISLAELSGNTDLHDQMIAYTNQKSDGVHFIRSKDLVQDDLVGDWVVYPFADDRFFAIPDDITHDFYMINPSLIFQYDYSKLPGAIDAVDVNYRQSLMLLQGTREDGSLYHCLSGIGVDQGPECVYLEDLMDDNQAIMEMGWFGDEDVVMIYLDQKQYSYNYWSDQLVEIDQSEEKQEIGVLVYQQADSISNENSDWKMFRNIIYNWKQKKAYRLDVQVKLYPLDQQNYFLTVSANGSLNMLDLLNEKYYYLGQVDQSTQFYLLERGYLITTP
ncbi:MAG: hypothetical protein ABIH67_03450 [Candidatus Uhrbacteria bacterium]